MQLFPNVTGYKVRDNAIKAFERIRDRFAANDFNYRRVKWLVASQADGTYIVTVIKDPDHYAMDIWHAGNGRIAIAG